MGGTAPDWVGMWRTMMRIRRFEETVSRAYADGKIPGFIHLSIGQEAIAAGVCGALREDDYTYVSHRGHGQTLAKGADPRLMMAELFGKETGYCKGRGGSMHIAAFDIGVLGANAIVGGSFPLAVGAGYAVQTQGGNQVVAMFFGDGAVNEGTFHESLNLASLWKLPVLFVCENNGYAQFTPLMMEHANPEISQHASAYGMEGVCIDGNNIEAVYNTAWAATDRARRGDGPTLIECLTYRWHGHYEGDPERYRVVEEVEDWKSKDPIPRVQQHLLDTGALAEQDIVDWEAEVAAQLEEAIQFAEKSPVPEPGGALQDVYI